MLYEFFDTKKDNRLSWIGKERDKESLLGDFGARKYDFLSARFTSIDPLWEKYYEWTPYQYSLNRPISLIDFSGLAVAGEINWSSSSFGYAFSMGPQDENFINVQNGDNGKTANENVKGSEEASTNTEGGEYTFWNFLWDAGYYIPVWGQCQLASDCINRGAYGEALVHWLTGLGEAILITHGYYSSAGLATKGVVKGGFKLFGKTVEKATPRMGRDGKAVEIIFKDGSKIDINKARVKKWIPNTHPKAPAGTLQKVKFNNSLPGSKGYKRLPTQQELNILNRFKYDK